MSISARNSLDGSLSVPASIAPSTHYDLSTLCGYCAPYRNSTPLSESSKIRFFGNILFYPHSGFLFGADSPGTEPPQSGKRGVVDGFSSASASRFRRRLLQFVGTRPCWAITLTIRDYQSPERWRRCLDAFGKRVVRLGDCGFWRVELQRRGTPHLHCLAYCSDPSAWRAAWLSVWGVSSDPAHFKHAVKFCSAHGSGWLTYVATHATKHKEDQLGWLGRQWGIFNRRALVLRPFEVVTLPLAFYDVALGVYKGWCLSNGRYVPRWRYMTAYEDNDQSVHVLQTSISFSLSDFGQFLQSRSSRFLSFAVGIAPVLGVSLPLSAYCDALSIR